jgi:predicted transcriptional regulator
MSASVLTASPFSSFVDSLNRERSLLGTVANIEPFRGLAPDKPVSLHELLQKSGVGVVEFAKTLQILEKNGFVRLSGRGPDEKVELTQQGAQMLTAGE